MEAPCRGASNEYPQHMFFWRTRQNYPRVTNVSSLTISLICISKGISLSSVGIKYFLVYCSTLYLSVNIFNMLLLILNHYLVHFFTLFIYCIISFIGNLF